MNWNFQNSYTELPSIYYSNGKPDNFYNPRLLLFNTELANELNLNINNNEREICNFLLGKKLDKIDDRLIDIIKIRTNLVTEVVKLKDYKMPFK